MDSAVTKGWSLHPQLAHDTVPVGDLPLARVLLMNDANYPWLILVPRRPGFVEIIDLDENEQAQLLAEIAAAARALKASPDATSSTSRRSAMWCRNCMCMSSRAGIGRRLAEAGVGRGAAIGL